MSRIRVRIKGGHKARVNIKNAQPVQVRTDTTYLYDPTIIDKEVQQAKDWAIKTDGLVEEEGVGIDYSAKAYAVGGTGTTTNNAKYYAELAREYAEEAGEKYKGYVHEQGVASAVWDVQHNLNKFPSVMVVDTADEEIISEVKYIDENNVKIIMNAASKGKAYLT